MYALTTFFILSAVGVGFIAERWGGGGGPEWESSGFVLLQIRFLIVWGLAVLGDWLQGPYFYLVYERHGYDRISIQRLFIIGCISAASLGVYLASLADRVGRRRMAIVYFGIYALACFCVHFQPFWVLVVGRVCSGIATSLLFVVFDSYYVQQSKERGFPEKSLKKTFKKASLIQGFTAVIAGIVTQPAVEGTSFHTLGPLAMGKELAAYDLAILVFLLGVVITCYLWEDDSSSLRMLRYEGNASSFKLCNGLKRRKVVDIVCLGGIQTLFESSMNAFTVLWTPAMQRTGEKDLPFGMIFAGLMASLMLGSILFSASTTFLTVEMTLSISLVVGMGSLVGPGVWQDAAGYQVFLAFCVFESCVGVYYACIFTLKAKIVPEKARASIYGVFRIPINTATVLLLLLTMPVAWMFRLCGALIGGGLFIVLFMMANSTTQDKLAVSISNRRTRGYHSISKS
ncbi:hypothetical protein AAMO2058_000155400 [Amorphochlora amoebiformis]